MTVGVDLPPVVQAGAAAKSLPPFPGADPAGAEAFLPAFVESMPSKSAADSTCTSLICQMDPGTDLVLLTLYVMLCFTAMTVMLKLVELLRETVWETIDLLRDARASATRVNRR